MQSKGKVTSLYNSLYKVLEIGNENHYICHKRKTLKDLCVGDNVAFEWDNHFGNIISKENRNNCLPKPNIANIDQVFLFISVKSPEYNFEQIETMLEYFHFYNLATIILVNKTDLLKDNGYLNDFKLYETLGYQIRFISLLNLQMSDNSFIKNALRNKTTLLAGNSGVGKSTFVNLLIKPASSVVNEVSPKSDRGRHTTKQIYLHYSKDLLSFVADSPGFSAFERKDRTPEDIRLYYTEFAKYTKDCKYSDCLHLNEPHCAVLQAVQEGKINLKRYNNYKKMYLEYTEQKKHAFSS